MLPSKTNTRTAPGGRVTALFIGYLWCLPWCLCYHSSMSQASFEKKLSQYTREFFAAHPEIKLVAVTGSAGKASAKQAIATMLAQRYAVAMSEPEPQSLAQTLLQIMGVRYPEKPEKSWGFFQRRRLLRMVKRRARAEHPEPQIIIQEFNPRELGFHARFATILIPDVTVVTSVTTGRMHVEHSIEQVAQEMLTLANNSRFALINRDDIDGRFAAFLTNAQMSTYGTTQLAEYNYEEKQFSLEEGHEGTLFGPEFNEGLAVRVKLFGEHNIRPAVAATALGARFGLTHDDIRSGVAALRSLPGRMQLFRGADGSFLIDDSYSSSPLTALSALQTLYSLSVPQRIAVFGNMNGLRAAMPQGHAELGQQCSPDELDWVVTVGEFANQYLAPAARQRGCQVKECRDAIEAGGFVRDKLKAGGVALFKGSSGGVWLEEAVKINLHSTSDEQYLVRQSPDWLQRKHAFFSRFSQKP